MPATATWLSSVSADWNTPSGWSTDDVPNSIAIVALISEPGSYTVSITVGESFAVGGVILSSASTAAITGTLEVSGGTLDNTGLFSVGDIGTGTLVVDGGGLVAETQNDFDIGTSVGSYGTVVVDGGTLDTPGGSTNVGDAGTGALSVNGGTVSANGLDVGAAATGSGFATIANGLLSTDGGVVGNNGTGTLSIGAGGTVMSGPGLEIGEYSTGQGTVIVNAGTLEAMNTGYNAGITVGVLGTGTLIVENSGLVEISANEGSNSLSVGDAAAGVMEINSGGVAGAQIVSIGGPYGGNGTVTVGNGGMLSGSEIDVSNSPTGTSSGTLTVETGGSVFASNLIEGADGTVTINGSVLTGGFDIGNVVTGLPVMTVGSLGVVNNYFGNSFVGKATAGVLTVQAGGTVTGNGANVLNIQHGGTVMVNGGTLGGYGDIAVGGIQDAPNIGTLAAAAGTLEGTLVTVGDGGLVEATTATIGTAITQGDIGTLAIDAGGTVVLSSVTLSTDALLSLDLLLLDGGSLGPAVMIVSGAATIDGAATIEGTGTLEIGGSITGAGTLDLKGALTLQLDHGTSGGPAVMFQAGVAQTVILGTPFINSTAFAGMTVGLNALIDLGKGFAINAISYAPGTVGQNVTLDVTEGETSGTIAIDNVQFIGGAREFFITTNPTTGDAAIETIACFAAGTRIATPRGEIAVEALRVGDLVRTLLGEDQAPIIWIGHRQVDCGRHPQPRNVWPVRVATGAFGPGQPHTDLFLSPDHAVYVNEVLIPAKHLINGSSIAQVPMDRVTYYHLELPQHAVVLAQGLPTESFLDLKDGSNYASRPGPVRLYPDFPARIWEAFGCAPLIVTGPELAAARAVVGRFATMQFAA